MSVLFVKALMNKGLGTSFQLPGQYFAQTQSHVGYGVVEQNQHVFKEMLFEKRAGEQRHHVATSFEEEQSIPETSGVTKIYKSCLEFNYFCPVFV